MRKCLGWRHQRVLSSGAIAIAAAVIQVMLLASAAADASMLTKAECRDRTVVDFEEVLNEMRPAAHPPSPGRLSFGPPGLRLSYIGSTVLPGGGQIGFSLRNEAERREVQLFRWTARSSLAIVRKNGSVIRTLREKRQALDHVVRGALERMPVGDFRVSRRPAFYRLNIAFKQGSVTKARYYKYFRVVPHQVDLRLALSSRTLRPGEPLTWRLENFGTYSFTYGLDYRIDRYESGQWLADPISPMGFPKLGFLSTAGTASQCQSIALPLGMSPGRYRVSKTMSSGPAESQEPASEFWILPN